MHGLNILPQCLKEGPESVEQRHAPTDLYGGLMEKQGQLRTERSQSEGEGPSTTWRIRVRFLHQHNKG